MSSKKITDADKLEIVDLYRQSGDTTASLASRYGVSNSTISRLLKTSIPETEYEILIQQKRGSKPNSEEEIPTVIDLSSATAPPQIRPERISDNDPHPLDSSLPDLQSDQIVPTVVEDDRDEIGSSSTSASDDNSANRRVRRRSSAPSSDELVATSISVAIAEVEEPKIVNTPTEISEVETADLSGNIDSLETSQKTLIQPPISRTPVLRDILADSKDRYSNPPPTAPIVTSTEDTEDDSEPEDVNLLAAMFGEEIADGDDDDEDEDADLEDDGDSSYQQLDRDRVLTEDRLHVQVKPLSQATLPRTCYIVIDKFAELIVRPLKDFADLGQISSEETQQRTLPVFDNHRVAKRFSNQRTQRVIKVPDSRIFYKTTQHLRLKGITCLLVDGNIYSLN
jgi:lambda repressor-like predicted transcriptional regulator